ncbi:MAG: hypothetical protein QNJ04_12475 [Desulfobacterales bacterium]|nr:hypothetical protein [Desulfobacterales bacterium]
MTTYNRRIFIRRYLEAPIEVQGHERAESRPAIAFDCCKEGMHFFSADYIGPGSTIIIRPCDEKNPFLGDVCETALRARVVWCRRCVRANKPGFSIGVHFSQDERRSDRPDR